MTINIPNRPKSTNTEDRAAGFISGGGAKAAAPASTPAPAAEAKERKAIVNMRFDKSVLARIDAAAKGRGMSRTSWLHWAAVEALRTFESVR